MKLDIGDRSYRRWKLRPEILLCPNIPKPMHGLAPRVVLGQSWWNKTRRAAYESTNFRCQACGVHMYRARGPKWLEGHELYETDYRAGRLTYLETVPLCNYCHSYIHDGRLTWLLESGQLGAGKFAVIMQHGNRVLSGANLVRPSRAQREADLLRLIKSGDLAAWSDWRLVLFGAEYPPLYENEDEWAKAHG